MKNPLFTFILLLFLSPTIISQSPPQGIPYQAVVRNPDGSELVNSPVNLTFLIHEGAANGTVVYEESHSLVSSSLGVVSCVVGNGVVSQGNFDSLYWGASAMFLHVKIGAVDFGTQQMRSVPYSLFAGSTSLSVSLTGDTLTIGGRSVIVPGVSAANPPFVSVGGLGSQVLPGNLTCDSEYISISGCGKETSLTYYGRVYDLEEIGGQCWFADNLATDHYSNGDPIPTGLDNSSWSATSSGAYAYYDNDPSNDATYGKLYNWYTTIDSRGLCPVGWHVPSDCEWMYLEGSLGMSVENQQLSGGRGTSQGGALKATNSWTSPNTGATNSTGFTALPGGYRNYPGAYLGVGIYGYWWSRTQSDSYFAWSRVLYYNRANASRINYNKRLGFSVRCIRD